MEQTETNI